MFASALSFASRRWRRAAGATRQRFGTDVAAGRNSLLVSHVVSGVHKRSTQASIYSALIWTDIMCEINYKDIY